MLDDRKCVRNTKSLIKAMSCLCNNNNNNNNNNNLRGFSQRVNGTNEATAACRLLVSTFAERGCFAWSARQIPYGRILAFLGRSRYFVFQVSPQLYS
jgi:hypothetical protein